MKTTEARKLLGVGPDAPPHAIKKAFRQLAMLWHPDRNPAPSANEMFTRLKAACNHLLAKAEEHTPPGKAASRGEDRNQDIELDLTWLCLGGQAEVVLETRTECSNCSGQGYQECEHSQLCSHCQGSGRIRHGKSLARCNDCGGRGYTRRIRCPHCDNGQQTQRRILTVTVPPGMLPGDELRLEGKGHPASSPKGRPGDLRLRIQLRPHPLYTLDGSDIVIERPVSIFALLGGGTVAVPSPGGLRHLELKPGSGKTHEQNIPSAGIPARGTRAAGNLRVRLVPMLPSTQTPALIKLYRALQAEIGPDNTPELANWEKHWIYH